MKLFLQSSTVDQKFIFKIEGENIGLYECKGGNSSSDVFNVSDETGERIIGITEEKPNYVQEVEFYLEQNISKIEMKDGGEIEEGMEEKLREFIVLGLKTQDFGSGNKGWMTYMIKNFTIQHSLEITWK